MASPAETGRALATQLPDEPRWVETRALLLSGFGEITGGASVATGFVVRGVEDAFSTVAVVGRPPGDAIVRAVEGLTMMSPVLAQLDNAAHVERALAQAAGPVWSGERAVIHRLQDDALLPAARSGPAVRLLDSGDSLDHLPPGLRYEITEAQEFAPIAAVIIGGVAASFCYPAWRTETLWDISIDTVDAFRGRMLGGHAVRFMTDLMRKDGREPVWGALESNAASLRLAGKLGFQPVDAVVCFARGPWAFLTGGFDPERQAPRPDAGARRLRKGRSPRPSGASSGHRRRSVDS